ncbi:hypothetical protein RJ639_009935 [Escallonia herrerae]|uniref:Bet v I/Major latex protein domain-containing protein n=1 Tax=Escallonia herrerae TaxID=1293975 RepID=A0AA89ASJ5_9ASTE|nr:hypothetical protein RJ639_009935 [Escallonia herrerae]
MYGTLSHETEVNVPASEAWALYGTLELTYICVPDLFAKIDISQGDGGVGTVITPTTNPGSLFSTYVDKILLVDNKKMVKEVHAYQGGYLGLGFNSYLVRFEVIGKSKTSCTTKVTVEYDVKEGFIANTVHVSIEPFIGLVNYGNNYLIKNHKK